METSRNMGINMNTLFYKLILLMPSTTLLQGLVGQINTILFGVIAIVLFYLTLNKPIYRNTFFLFCVVILNHVYALIYTNFYGINNMNTLYYYAFWILFSMYICADYDNIVEFIKENERFVCFSLKLSIIIMAISAVMPSSYSSGFFKSFSGSSARACSVAIFMLTMILLITKVYKIKKYIWFCLIPIYCVVMGDSRTYLGVSAMLLIIMLWNYFENKKYFYFSLLPVIAIGISVVVSTNIMTKMESAVIGQNTYYSAMEVFTSGRSTFWLEMLTAWWKTGWMHRLFGDGFHFVYTIRTFWAHNDFVQLLLTFGITGLLTYLISIKRMISTFFTSRNVKWFILVLVCFLWFFNAFFNMFYVYMCACTSFPFLLFAIGYEDNIESREDITNAV